MTEPRSRSEGRILQAAIELFAECGYAAGAREIADRAGSTTMTMYRAFRKGKESLFEEALRVVIGRSFDPGKFVLFIYEGEKSADLASLLCSGLQRWYFSIQPADVRLVAQARLSNNRKWQGKAAAAVEKIIDILATTMERQLTKKQKQDFDARMAARVVITVLLETKLAPPSKGRSQKPRGEEAREVEGIVNYCFAGLARGIKE